MLYTSLKSLHVTCAALSIFGFALRGAGWIGRRRWVRRRWVRVAPHAIDTVFLLSGVGMAILLRLDPIVHPWLGAKIVGLVGYVILGLIASRALDRRTRLTAYLLALALFAWLVSVALLKSPWGLLGPF